MIMIDVTVHGCRAGRRGGDHRRAGTTIDRRPRNGGGDRDDSVRAPVPSRIADRRVYTGCIGVKAKDRVRLSGMRRAVAEVAGSLRRMRRVELARRGAAAPEAARARSATSPACWRPAGAGSTTRSTRSSRSGSRPASASSTGCSAADSCPARSCCSAASPASASRRSCCRLRRTSRRRRAGALRLGRGVRAPDQDRAASASVSAARRSISSPRRASSGSSKRSRGSAGAPHRGFDSDRLLVEVPVGAGQHRPGARGGHAAAVHGEGAEHPDVSRRPRDEGRQRSPVPRRSSTSSTPCCTSRASATTRTASSAR